MVVTPRRSFLRDVLLALGWTSTQANVQTQEPQRRLDTDFSPRARAIRALRLLNTIENRHRQINGSYLTLEESMRSDIAEYLVARLPIVDLNPAVVALTGELLDGFSTSFHLSGDRSDYTVILSDISSERSYKTDRTGVIQEGITAPAVAFNGSPIVRPSRQVARISSGPKAVLTSLVGFFFPVIHAAENCVAEQNLCCEGGGSIGCSGRCVPPGGCHECCNYPPLLLCCNLGYSGCTWCCVYVQEGCECSYGC
jgi:hypothetical protein